MTTTLILGASEKPERYSNKALRKLVAHGHTVIPVSPKPVTIEGIECITDISQAQSPVDTVTVYVNPVLLEQQIDKIISLNPRRVILNPGTESSKAAKRFEQQGILVIEDCTLIMLDTGTY